MQYFRLETITAHLFNPFSYTKDSQAASLTPPAKLFSALAGLGSAAAVAYGRRATPFVCLLSLGSAATVFYLATLYFKWSDSSCFPFVIQPSSYPHPVTRPCTNEEEAVAFLNERMSYFGCSMEETAWKKFTEAVKPKLFELFHPIDPQAKAALEKPEQKNKEALINEIRAHEAKHSALFCICLRAYKAQANPTDAPLLPNFSNMELSVAGLDQYQSSQDAAVLFKKWLGQLDCNIDEPALEKFLSEPVQKALLENIQKICTEFQSSQEKLDAFFCECAEMLIELKNIPTNQNVCLKDVSGYLVNISRDATIAQALAQAFVELGQPYKIWYDQKYHYDHRKTFRNEARLIDGFPYLTPRQWKYLAKIIAKVI
jgi:hypothetical protein